MHYFVQHDYHNKPAFSGMLPGIAGVHGIPLWVFYVNRGQGIAGFGIESKDGCIAEFFSALKAYHMVREQGFRTFIRFLSDGKSVIYEPFLPENRDAVNEIQTGFDELTLVEENRSIGLRVEIRYRTLAEAPVGALIRELTLINTGKESRTLEILDGLPFLVPAGVDYKALTTTLTTAQAWMKVFPLQGFGALYRVGAGMEDSASVEVQKFSNFAAGFRKEGKELKSIASIFDPDILFSPQQFMSLPRCFAEKGVAGISYENQIREGKLPCAFFADSAVLAPGESREYIELYGGGGEEQLISAFFQWFTSGSHWSELIDAGRAITERIVEKSFIRTSHPVFDTYCRQNFLDNVMRGGLPHFEGAYIPVYSRKHGDLERDYNWFVIPPEYYSQGWGNYRDVIQNRRSDIFFAPEAGKEILKEFIGLIQTDGYNPLVVQGRTFCLPPAEASGLDRMELPETCRLVLKESFSPGALYAALRSDIGPDEGSRISETFRKILSLSKVQYNALHGEGFWIDHWTYLNDLVENYYALFPDRIQALFWEERNCPWFTSGHTVLPRKKRWEATEKGIRQYEALLPPDHKPESSWMRDRRGEIYYAAPGEKLLGLAAIKFLSRDPFGIGIEMEAGKPGWYDALNGLPGILGSSLPESWELLRLLRILQTIALQPLSKKPVEAAQEICELYGSIQEFLELPVETDRDLHLRWNRMMTCLEEYRESTARGFKGRRNTIDPAWLSPVLKKMEADVTAGLERGKQKNNGALPTYITVQPTELLIDSQVPDFDLQFLPLFLEGFTRALPLQPAMEGKKNLHSKVMESELYDRKLAMLRVNAPLDALSHEIGRARAFSPGWLENGSIWLHMQYKYLLAMLHAGLYEEFLKLSRTMLVPFMDPDVYGRSPNENSSFIVSSLHPDKALHGRGFVARLSGATAEFISMLICTLWGHRPFRCSCEELQLVFDPCLPDDLFDSKREISAMFLGTTMVTYLHRSRGDIFPGSEIGIKKISLYLKGGDAPVHFTDAVIPAPYAEAFREGKIERALIELDRIGRSR
jgi:hypothetical protein